MCVFFFINKIFILSLNVKVNEDQIFKNCTTFHKASKKKKTKYKRFLFPEQSVLSLPRSCKTQRETSQPYKEYI